MCFCRCMIFDMSMQHLNMVTQLIDGIYLELPHIEILVCFCCSRLSEGPLYSGEVNNNGLF